ncbi:MAG: hypothetical protein OHK0013_47450 [Sandaracinaceae bacterium]
MPAGRLVELCGGADVAQTSAAIAVVAALQRRGEHVAWIAPRDAGLFPPDWQHAGVQLDALLVVHVPEDDPRAGPRAAEMLLRTGVMGAVVLDMSSVACRVREGRSLRRGLLRGEAWMGRLLGLAREHGSRLLLLSPLDRAQPSLGPLVSVRLAMHRAQGTEGRAVHEPRGRLALEAVVLKDKSGLLAAIDRAIEKPSSAELPRRALSSAELPRRALPSAELSSGEAEPESANGRSWRRAG